MQHNSIREIIELDKFFLNSQENVKWASIVRIVLKIVGKIYSIRYQTYKIIVIKTVRYELDQQNK